MLVAPLTVVAYADILHELFGCGALDYGHGEGLYPGCRGNPAAVAVGLLSIVVILLYKNITATVDGGEETYWWQVCRTEQYGLHQLYFLTERN